MIRKIVFIFLLILSCSKEKNNTSVNKTGAEEAAFNTIDSKTSGIEFSNDLKDTGNLNIIEYLYYYNGGGVAIGDINNDGLDDIYLTANQKPDKLYLNLGGLKFKDISETSGISKKSTWSTGVTMADVNSDGLLDIYVCKVGNYKTLKASNELYINTGNNTFKEQAEVYGLNFSGFSTQASFFDYDNDGDLDMYLLNHSIHSPYSYGNINLRDKPDALAGDVLYENVTEKGTTKFIDVTKNANIYNSALGYGLAIATSDVNNDGFMDIYVGNDFHENDYLYINNGDKTFTESSAAYFNSTSRFTMGVDIADINNDEKLDVITLDMMPFKSDIFLKSGGEDSDKVNLIKESFGFQQQYARNHLQINKGNHFVDAALITETYATDWSWSPLILDYDNDGLNDIYITNGIYKRPNDLDYINFLSNFDFAKYNQTAQDTLEQKLIKTMPMLSLPNVLLKNKGDLAFKKALANNNTGTYSNGAAYSDLDNDGDIDIVVNNINEKASLLENKTSQTTKNTFLTVQLFETNKGLNTNGAKVFLFADGKIFFKEQTTTKGFQSSSTRQVHFGLHKISKIDSLKVVWQDGTQTVINALKANTTVTVNKEKTTKYNYKPKTIETFLPFDFEHTENNYLDYEREALMPEKLSTEGPSVVQADFNKDGLQDLFIGGARNQAPVLYLQNTKGDYVIKNVPVFQFDKIYEDVDAIAFDIDGDNDLDIYALSGGNDFPEGDPMLEDRVYINDGKGNFTRLNSKLLATNGGSVSSFDFDNDGLEDLFIGSRSIPGAYGLSPYSYILKNKGNNSFEIVLKKRFGMVTDSQWADLNNDGNIELILAGDWMPITVLSNNTKARKFENKTEQYGLSKTNGMWNVVKIADVNNDGKLDIIGGNTGLNFKWKASETKPVTMYLDDFDKNEQLDQLIFYDFFGTNVSFASKDKLMQQMPFLKKKFLNYNTFSKVKTLSDLMQKKESDILETKYIYELRSMIYINNGTKFSSKALPQQAQLSTIEDVFTEKNKIVFTGNYYGFVTELGISLSNSGGLITSSENNNYTNTSLFNLPKNFSGRKIVKLKEGQFLMIANNGKSYIVNNKK